MTYPTDVFAGWTDQGTNNVIVDVGIVDAKSNLQQDVLTNLQITAMISEAMC